MVKFDSGSGTIIINDIRHFSTLGLGIGLDINESDPLILDEVIPILFSAFINERSVKLGSSQDCAWFWPSTGPQSLSAALSSKW
jgi:hypothetical protein